MQALILSLRFYFATLKARRALEPKYVTQLFPGSLLGTRQSAIGQFFPVPGNSPRGLCVCKPGPVSKVVNCFLKWQIGSLSSDVFERRSSTGSEPFYLFKCHDATRSVLLSVFTLTETICPKIGSKSLLKSTKSQLPVDARLSKRGCFNSSSNLSKPKDTLGLK